jgi:hypothetical protein
MRVRPWPFLLLAAACGGDAAAGALATRADSAGIEIVTNTVASWGARGGWRVDPEPMLEIGPRPDDDPRYDFLRVSGGTILPNGEIAVLVSSTREIRFFSAEGEWLRTAGRDGEGPGEMRGPAGLTRAGDTLFVPDVQLGRLSAFSTSGAFLASWPFLTTEASGRIFPNHRLADGSWIGSSQFFGGSSMQMPSEGLSRPNIRFFHLSADLATLLDTVATTAGAEMVMTSSTSGGSGDGMRRMFMFSQPPLGRSAPAMAAGDRFLWGDNASPELRIHAPDGTLRTILRWEGPAIPVDAALIERVKQEAIDRSDGSEAAVQRIEARYATPSPAPVVPWFNGIHVDSEGAIWVREYAPLLADSVRFRIFHTDGQLLGQRAFPPRTTVLEIGREHILTVWQDDDDLEYVRVYRLKRDGE